MSTEYDKNLRSAQDGREAKSVFSPKTALNRSTRKNKTNNDALARALAVSLMLAAFAVSVFVIRFFILQIGVSNPIRLAGNGDGENDGAIPVESELKKFSSAEELRNFFLNNEASNSYEMMYGMSKFGMRSDVNFEKTKDVAELPSMPQWGEALAPSNFSEEGYSRTNAQVGGVDEADIIKTDGKYVYAISGNIITIIRAYPAENAEILSTINLDSAPQGMYVSGDKLAVYGQKWKLQSRRTVENSMAPAQNIGFTFVKIYDISDRLNPEEERNLYFEGSATVSRMIGDYVYLVTSSQPKYGYEKSDSDFAVVPLIMDGEEELYGGGKEIACGGCLNVYYFDMPYNSYTYATVSAINMQDSDEKPKSEVFLLDQSQNNTYVSKSNLYITYTKYVSEQALTMDIMLGMMRDYVYPEMSPRDKLIFDEIWNAKSYILTSEEKFEKIGRLLEKYRAKFENREYEFEKEFSVRIKQKYDDISEETEKTYIYKIGIDKGELSYKSSGAVTGAVLNQFSMDESGEYFRIATTKNRTWSRFSGADTESYSNLYVLDSNMNQVGKIEKIARGEQIYSARFMQDRAYLVTFRRTDPLFVISLNDPRNPKILGKLKVPGYSSYLHPYDDVTLIGIGKESDENGRIIGGVKLSLFDVSEVENPREIGKYVIGDASTDSIAINEHKAFLFSKEKNLLVIPVQGVSKEMEKTFMDEGISFEEQEMMMPKPRIIMPTPIPLPEYFNGVYVINVDSNKGFELRGLVSHDKVVYDSNLKARVEDEKMLKLNGREQILRSLYINDMLYTLSNTYLGINKLNNLLEVKKLELN